MHLELQGKSIPSNFPGKNLARTSEQRRLFAKRATEPLSHCNPCPRLLSHRERKDLTVPRRHAGERPALMHEVGNFSELPTAPPAPGLLWRGFLPSLARANRQQLMNSIKDHLPARSTGAAAVRREDGIARTGIGFLSNVELLLPNAVLLYSASSTLILKTHNINNSTSTQIQMYYTHRYTSMYIFSCRGNMIFMLYKMNKENRKPRILG